jgi:hypothetical protein
MFFSFIITSKQKKVFHFKETKRGEENSLLRDDELLAAKLSCFSRASKVIYGCNASHSNERLVTDPNFNSSILKFTKSSRH